jgi:hypothetical protein
VTLEVPARSFPCDQQRQLERLGKTDMADLPGRRHGDEQVSAFKRSAEDGARMALARSTLLLPGAERRSKV